MPDASTMESWELLVRYHRLATAEMDRRLREKFGFSLDDYDVLQQVHTHHGPIRMGALAERLLVANSSCNRIVGRLVQAGYLVRTHGSTDRREIFVGLTAEGSRLRRRMAAVHVRDIERLLAAPLSSTERRQLARILGRLLPPI